MIAEIGLMPAAPAASLATHFGEFALGELDERIHQPRAEFLLRVDQRKSPREARLQGNRHQLAELALLFHGDARHDRKTEAGGHDTLQGLRTAQFHLHLQILRTDARLVEIQIRELARAGPGGLLPPPLIAIPPTCLSLSLPQPS